MTLPSIGTLSNTGEEPPELLRPLFFEYLTSMNRLGQCELLELTGANGTPLLLAVIPNAKVDGPKIVDAFKPNEISVIANEEKQNENPS